MTSKNYFVENNRTTSVTISKDRVNYQELQKNNYIGFFFPRFVAHSHLIKLFKFVNLLTACQTFSKYNWVIFGITDACFFLNFVNVNCKL